MRLALVLPVFVASALAVISNMSLTVSTECKKCPYTLCPNIASYESYGDSLNLTCWTEGTEIVGDTTWLKTQDGCYVTQYDVTEYDGDYTVDLPYCGRIQQRFTTATARTKYLTDCFYTPVIDEWDIKHYVTELDLTVTCVTEAYAILGKKKWYKTLANCYVHESTLYRVPGEDRLDPCGPVPNIDPTNHEPEPVTVQATAVPTAFAQKVWKPLKPAPSPSAAPDRPLPRNAQPHLAKRFLYNTTIGEEYVNCTYNATLVPSRTKKVYEFGQEVIPQCGTYGDSPQFGDNSTIFLLTTDFCYVKDNECDPGLTESFLRSQYFPHCEDFVDRDGQGVATMEAS